MKKTIALVLAMVMWLSFAACASGETLNANAASETQQDVQNNPGNVPESPYANHPLIGFLYGEWELEDKAGYIQDEELPCSALTINEDGTCVADGAAGTWEFAEGIRDNFLSLNVFINGEHKFCVGLYGSSNRIGVWTVGYNGPVDDAWTNRSMQGDGDPQHETLEITLDNWQDYFELEMVVATDKNEFDEFIGFAPQMTFRLKEEWAGITTDMNVVYEYNCTDSYACWCSYNMDTGEFIEGEKTEDYVPEPWGAIRTLDGNHIEEGTWLFGNSRGNTLVVEGNIASIVADMYSSVEIIRIQGTITVAE